MPSDPRRRQKKLERRNARRKEKKHIQVRESNAGLPERLTDAARYPVLHSRIGVSIEDEGMGWVVLSRALPNGSVAVATFLIDRYCLGVKNVHAEVLDRVTYDSKYVQKMRTDMPSREAPPAEARKLVEQAVAYARDLGLPPHPDYARAMLIFGTIDPNESNAVFEFGKDGKPLFIAGPHDTPERCRQILAILEHTAGPGQYHYIIPMGSRADLLRGDGEGIEFEEDDDEDLPGSW
jgi:hypothetical protein